MDMTAAARAPRATAMAPEQLDLLVMTGGCWLVDVREAEELDGQGMLPGASHVPSDLLASWVDPGSPRHRPDLDPVRRAVLYCADGSRSARAATMLEELGHLDVAYLAGGIIAWRRAGLPVVHRDD